MIFYDGFNGPSPRAKVTVYLDSPNPDAEPNNYPEVECLANKALLGLVSA